MSITTYVYLLFAKSMGANLNHSLQKEREIFMDSSEYWELYVV